MMSSVNALNYVSCYLHPCLLFILMYFLVFYLWKSTIFILLFNFFQVPVVPLQRPDEIHIPNNSWMQTSGFEDMCCEQGIPTMITWSYGGKDVAVEGSWDNWKTRFPKIK